MRWLLVCALAVASIGAGASGLIEAGSGEAPAAQAAPFASKERARAGAPHEHSAARDGSPGEARAATPGEVSKPPFSGGVRSCPSAEAASGARSERGAGPESAIATARGAESLGRERPRRIDGGVSDRRSLWWPWRADGSRGESFGSGSRTLESEAGWIVIRAEGEIDGDPAADRDADAAPLESEAGRIIILDEEAPEHRRASRAASDDAPIELYGTTPPAGDAGDEDDRALREVSTEEGTLRVYGEETAPAGGGIIVRSSEDLPDSDRYEEPPEGPGRGATPGRDPDSRPMDPEPRTGTPLACYREADGSSRLLDADAMRLCEYAPSTAPVDCYQRAARETNLLSSQKVDLCRCASDTRPVECALEARRDTLLNQAQTVSFCRAVHLDRLYRDCRPIDGSRPHDPGSAPYR